MYCQRVPTKRVRFEAREKSTPLLIVSGRQIVEYLVAVVLFTYNDFKTMLFPSAAFAIFSGSATIRSTAGVDNVEGLVLLFSRLPAALLWAWVNLLAFTVNNQRQPESIEEDRLNKPWRPIPAGRMSRYQAGLLASLSYPLAIATSVVLGKGVAAASLLMVFGYLYNDLKLGKVSILTRNILNACGFTSFAAGTLEVALHATVDLRTLGWLFIIGLVVGTTVHTQDMYDQAGDQAAGRRTIPIVIGDEPARWTIALTVSLWSLLCPAYWRCSALAYLIPVGLGLLISGRSLVERSVKADKTTFRIYNLWLVSLYALPLIQSYDASGT